MFGIAIQQRGVTADEIGFVVVDVLWRSNVRDYKSRKRNERNTSN